MCGIAGMVSWGTEKVNERLLVRMADAMKHRGPDAGGTWTDATHSVGLAHRRLAVLDLSDWGNQPMTSPDGTVVLVYNGEIYNHLELRKELEATGHAFASHCDTEVLLHAYMEWGEDCLDRLCGMFAFAVWDGGKRRLFAARDRFGEKPFYYTVVGGNVLLFASEAKAIFAAGMVRPTAHLPAVYRFLVHGLTDCDEYTLFKGIKQLPAAHALTVDMEKGTIHTYCYWRLEPREEVKRYDYSTCVDVFREMFNRSVKLRLQADVPVGTSLSGGLDSSAIACTIRATGQSAVQKAFSARFEDPDFDEGKYIEAVAQETGIEAVHVYPDPQRMIEEMYDLLWHHEEPVQSSSIYAQWCVMRLAKKNGVTVLLDGQGGDEVLAGYHFFIGNRLADLATRGRIPSLIREGKMLLSHSSVGLRSIAASTVPRSIRFRIREKMNSNLAGTALKEADRLPPPPAAHPGLHDGLRSRMYQTLTCDMLPSLLHYADRNSMAFSREVRLPFLDHELVEFLFSVPAECLMGNGTTKRILRDATAEILPEIVRRRTDKLGFAPPEERWLRGPLKGWMQHIIETSRCVEAGWLDGKAVESLFAGFLERGGYARRVAVWRILSIETWARRFDLP